MELLGENIKGVYYRPCAGGGGNSVENSTYPWPPKDNTMVSLPWRPSHYLPPFKNFPCASFKKPCKENEQTQQQGQQHQQQQGYPSQDHYFQGCPQTYCGQGASPFIPYRRVLKGGVIKLMPEKDGSSYIRVPKPPPKCSPDHVHQQPFESQDQKPMPISGRDPDLPMTSKCARLNSCVQEMHEKVMDTKPFKPPCFPAALDPWRRTQAYQEIEKRIQDIQEKTTPEKTPMSQFPNDEKILKHAYRNYKRDVQLQKDKNEFVDPKLFRDEGDEEWHRQMVCSGAPQLDIRTENALMRSDCVRFPDGLGGHCYICPNDNTQKNNEKVACNTWFTDPICHKIDTQEWTGASEGVCSTKKQIEDEIKDTVLSVDSLTRQRNALHRRLMDSEQPLIELKEKLYSLPPEERNKDTDTIQEIINIEKCQRKIFDEIREKGRELTDMLIRQQDLENQLTTYIITNDPHKTCDKEAFEKYKY